MSDIKLFRISGPKNVIELTAEPHGLEKHLQTFMEQNLEALLGVRFVATEHSTGPAHGGRIDSLGLDENNSPVIIEYKRKKSDNVINQGLFYLDWLMDHKAEFQLLVQDVLGHEADQTIDWSGPRLLCIAEDFTKYDEHAVKQMGRNIDLLRYRRYGNELFLIELINSTTVASANGGTPQPKSGSASVDYKTVDQVIAENAGTELGDLYDDLRGRILALGDDVQEKQTKVYIAFKTIRNFASVEVQKKQLLIFLKLDPTELDLEEGFTRDVSEIGHFGTGKLEVRISSQEGLEKAWPLIERSYEIS